MKLKIKIICILFYTVYINTSVLAADVVGLKDTPITIYSEPESSSRLREIEKSKITLPTSILKKSPGYFMIELDGQRVWIEDWVVVQSTSRSEKTQHVSPIKVTPVAGIRGIGE